MLEFMCRFFGDSMAQQNKVNNTALSLENAAAVHALRLLQERLGVEAQIITLLHQGINTIAQLVSAS